MSCDYYVDVVVFLLLLLLFLLGSTGLDPFETEDAFETSDLSGPQACVACPCALFRLS